MNDNPTPHDKRLHFGCGLLFGAVITFLLLITSVAVMEGKHWLLVAVGSFVCGLLAMRHGEMFWDKASSAIETMHKWRGH